MPRQTVVMSKSKVEKQKRGPTIPAQVSRVKIIYKDHEES